MQPEDPPKSQSAKAQASVPAAPSPEVPAPEVLFSRRGAPRASWLWVALPVAGLLVVPLVGLVYAATSTFGKGEPETATSAALAPNDDDAEPGKPGAATKSRKTTAKKPSAKGRAGKPRSDAASPCCAKLHELGKTAEVGERAPYLSAAAACDAAPDADKAYARVKANLKTSKTEVPAECEP